MLSWFYNDQNHNYFEEAIAFSAALASLRLLADCMASPLSYSSVFHGFMTQSWVEKETRPFESDWDKE
jgi:hypothetical protein